MFFPTRIQYFRIDSDTLHDDLFQTEALHVMTIEGKIACLYSYGS